MIDSEYLWSLGVLQHPKSYREKHLQEAIENLWSVLFGGYRLLKRHEVEMSADWQPDMVAYNSAEGTVLIIELKRSPPSGDKKQALAQVERASTTLDQTKRKLAENAVYFGDGDHTIFPLLYLQVVENARPDVLIANPYGYPLESLYTDMPPEMKVDIHRIPNEEDDEIIAAWVVAHTDRPVYFVRKPPRRVLGDKVAANAGLLYRAAAADEVNAVQTRARALWNEYEWHTLDEQATQGDWTAELILFDYHFARGRHHLDEGDIAGAGESFKQGLCIAGRTKERLNNVASALADAHCFDQAEPYYSEALALDPSFLTARGNLGKLYMAKGQWEQAVAQFEEMLRQRPDDPSALRLRARCLVALGRKPGV